MKRYVDFTCLWEKVPNGLLYDWLKFSEENGQRLKKLLAKCPSERPVDEWRFLSQEASRKLWPMWTDINWNGSAQSERDCFMNDLAEKGKHENEIERLVIKAEQLILNDPLPHINVHLGGIEVAVNTSSTDNRPNYFVWSEFSFSN